MCVCVYVCVCVCVWGGGGRVSPLKHLTDLQEQPTMVMTKCFENMTKILIQKNCRLKMQNSTVKRSTVIIVIKGIIYLVRT